jgi:nitroreductase
MSTTVTLSPQELLEVQSWRYATKKFDPSKRIPAGLWEALEQALVLSPSSYGMQPWKFIVVTDPALKRRLRAVSWNQTQVEDCSHLVVFLAKQRISEADVDRLVQRTAEVRAQSEESLAGYKGFMMGDLVHGGRSAVIDQWAARQAYIALGNFMTSAALLGIDTCPLEGLEPAAYDLILGNQDSGYHTVCACPAGYRSVDDGYAAKPKVRFPAAEVIDHR